MTVSEGSNLAVGNVLTATTIDVDCWISTCIAAVIAVMAVVGYFEESLSPEIAGKPMAWFSVIWSGR
jgi:hypothetical protein